MNMPNRQKARCSAPAPTCGYWRQVGVWGSVCVDSVYKWRTWIEWCNRRLLSQLELAIQKS